MNTKGLKPALLLQGELFWIAWDSLGKPVFGCPIKDTDYLIVQGSLETLGYYDIEENSAMADLIRGLVEQRQHNWKDWKNDTRP